MSRSLFFLVLNPFNSLFSSTRDKEKLFFFPSKKMSHKRANSQSRSETNSPSATVVFSGHLGSEMVVQNQTSRTYILTTCTKYNVSANVNGNQSPVCPNLFLCEHPEKWGRYTQVVPFDARYLTLTWVIGGDIQPGDQTRYILIQLAASQRLSNIVCHWCAPPLTTVKRRSV